MKKTKILLAFLCVQLCILSQTNAQDNKEYITQTIRGTVLDLDSKSLLIGANVSIISLNKIIGTSTDIDGVFRLDQVPIGRHTIEVSYLGYKPTILSSILVTSAKELVINIELEESMVKMEAIEISAAGSIDKSKPLNSFATLSSRTFSVEETSRYAGANFDPARMALNYAGVTTGASDDLFNEIIIRGNTPSGVLWRLEGIEIPNPNHFGSFGNSGGAISMLSSSTLTNSDFYTGAFPAEFGNATSGVFDLKMRNGNNEKRETSAMLGALGIEFATEGPLSKSSKSSYLFNYRYSTLAVLQKTGINPTGDVLPTYQDLSFKLNFPTRSKGTFSLFGLGGNNIAANNPSEDAIDWMTTSDRIGFKEVGNIAVVGLSHNLVLSNDSYLKTIVSGSYEQSKNKDFFIEDNLDARTIENADIQQKIGRSSIAYHKKVNAKNTFRIGAIYSIKKLNFILDDVQFLRGPLERYYDNSAQTGLIQGFGQWKYKLNEKLQFNSGLHYSHLTFNNDLALEPRGALTYKINNKQEISVASGLHSRMENLAVYSITGTRVYDSTTVQAKKNLGLSKSIHNVIGYDISINSKMRLKVEGYFQYLFNIPIRKDATETYSLLNTSDVGDIFQEPELVPEGTGTNIGIDLTLEKFFYNGNYFLLTGSLYDSKYRTLSNKDFNTRFNGNYQLSILGGKEFKLGSNGKNILGFNAKVVSSGGARYTPIDLAASIAQDDEIFFYDRPFDIRTGGYFRFDIGISYKINTKHLTHSIMLDIQNVSNRENAAAVYYDDDTFTLEQEDQTGLFPFFNYRVEF